MVHPLILYPQANFRHHDQIDAITEMKNTDPPPTIKTILICHSMGGIIAVDSLFSMIDNADPIHTTVLGILAYDTPYLGLNPSVIHRTISTKINTISSAVNTARELIPQGLFTSKQVTTTTSSANTAGKAGRWGGIKTWGAVGAASVAAVGALSYFAKDPIVNHLQFVSVLYKPDDLSRRMKRLEEINQVGFTNFYTVVIPSPSSSSSAAAAEDGDAGDRTFCNVPREKGEKWIRQENGVVKDEVDAHCGMFSRGGNDHFEEMCRESLRILRDWIGAGYS